MNNNIVAAIPHTESIKNAYSNGIGRINPVIPNTNKILNKLDPIMFPITISECFFIAAAIHVTNSGKLVPNAMTVKPIIRSDTCKACAISMAESTVIFAPNISAAIPITTNKIIFAVDIVVTGSVSVLCFWLIMNKYNRNKANNAHKINAPQRDTMPYCHPKNIKSIDTKQTKGISYKTVFFWTYKLEIIALTPNINKILAIFDPNILPIPTPAAPCITEEIDTAASGALVPQATIVKPMTISGILNFFAMAEAPSTNISAPRDNNRNPMIKTKRLINIFPHSPILCLL